MVGSCFGVVNRVTVTVTQSKKNTEYIPFVSFSALRPLRTWSTAHVYVAKARVHHFSAMTRFLSILVVTSLGNCLGSKVAPRPSPPPAAPLAKNIGDVLAATTSSFATIGGVAFVWSAATKRSLPIGWQAAQKWGRISAGFSGGQALGQVVRKADDRWAKMTGAVFGGAAAATTIAEIPNSIFTFVAFSYALDVLSPPAAGGGSEQAAYTGEKIKWRGKSTEEIRAEAKARATADYERRHQGDAARLKAVQK